MSRTSGILTECSGRNCRLCRKNHEYYYNIFTSNVACNIAVKDAIHDLVGLHIAVGDGLPNTMCPLCLKKLTEFSFFKKICLESDAVLRKSLQSNCCRSFEGGRAADDNSGHSVETKGCIQDVIENNSQPTCSGQTTEIYLPVPDLVLPRVNELFHVKDEDKGNLSEENYPFPYTSDPAGISTNVSDPLATDELPNTLTASQGKKVEAQGTGAMVADLDWTLVGAKEEPSPEENAQLTLGEDGDPIESLTIAHESTTEAFGFQRDDGIPIQTTSTSYLPAEGNVRNYSIDECTGHTALVTQFDSNAGASLVKTERNLMDEDMEKYGVVDTDKKTNSSVPDDKQCNARNIESHRISGGGGAKTFFGEKAGCDAPKATKSLRNIRINRNDRRGCEAVMGDREEVPNYSINNPGHSYRSTEISFHCFSCRNAFNDKNELIKHMKIHFVAHNLDAVAESSIGEKSCSLCKKSFSRCNDLVSHMRTHLGENPHSCDKCEKSFSDESTLVQIVRKHAREKPYSCGICSKSFTRKGILNAHIRTHKGDRPFSCVECGKSFSNKYHLVTHIRTHTGEKPYTCSICSKSFAWKSSLNVHTLTHTGKRPFSCNTCSKTFSSQSNLHSHTRTHKGDRPFSCNECEKSFSNKYHLVCHIQTHTGDKLFSCNDCEKSFSNKYHFDRHIRIHTGERPFTCNECEKSFSNKYHLDRHIRIHMREKPYACNLCEKCFSYKSHLVRHVRTHSGKKPFYETSAKGLSRERTM